MAASKSPGQNQHDNQNSVASDGSFLGFSKLGDDLEQYKLVGPVSPGGKVRPPPIGPDEKEYRMHHMHRGKVIIFNHEEYYESLNLQVREGTNVDKLNIKLCFKKLNFDVEIHDNLTEKQIRSKLKEESKDEYHINSDCIVVVVLTHGEDQGYLYAADRTYHVDELWTNFTAVKCPALAVKPKIFIVQACRGHIPSQGLDVQKIQTDSRPTDVYDDRPYTIPAEADILVAYSTYEGRVAHRNTEDGTWFIEELCKELDINGEKDDLLSLLTNVNRHVAVDKEYNQFKQMPVIQSTLTRKLFFNNNSKGVQPRNLGVLLEIANDKLDHLTKALGAKNVVGTKRPLRKQSAITQWDGLRTNSKSPDITLPPDNTVYKLGRGLQMFLEDIPQPKEIQNDGETILHLLAAWENLHSDTHSFVYNRLTVFLNNYARDWRIFSLLDIPDAVAGDGRCHRRWSQPVFDSSLGSRSNVSRIGSLPRRKPINRK